MQDPDRLADRTPATDMERLVAALRARVEGLVCRRRAHGVPVERVIPEVRRLVREAELAEGDPDALGVLDAQVVRWALDAYLDEPVPRPVSRLD